MSSTTKEQQQQEGATSSSSSPYYHQVMAAPMVRVSTLAFRLLCAHYGSGVVWTEELVAAKLMKCSRKYLPQVNLELFSSSSKEEEEEENNNKQAENEKFTSVLEKLLLLEEEKEKVEEEEEENKTKSQKIVEVINRWNKIFPFLYQTIFAGRAEVIYLGHQNPRQQQNKKESSTSSATATAAPTTLGEGDNRPGEVVFTTLANLHNNVEKNININSSLKDSSFFMFPPPSSSSQNTVNKREILQFPLQENNKTLIGQIGAPQGEIAVAGFNLLAPFCRGVDVNMGCPKSFSVKNGMGASLMEKKDNAVDILGSLSKSFPNSTISYKTRLFEDLSRSLDHLKSCYDSTGGRLHALTLHGRHRPQRSETAPLYDDATEFLKMIRHCENSNSNNNDLRNLCVIFNGSIGLRKFVEVSANNNNNNNNNNQNQDASSSATAAASSSSSSSSALLSDKKEIDGLLSNDFIGTKNMLNFVTNKLGFDGALVARASVWRPSVFVEPNDNNNNNKTEFRNNICYTNNNSNNNNSSNSFVSASSFSFSTFPLLRFILQEFQSLVIVYAAAGENVRLLKYHLTRAIPEYQHADACKLHLLKDQQSELSKLFISCRDSKTYVEFARVLRFSEEEVEALLWMIDLVNWRRGSNTSCWEDEEGEEKEESGGKLLTEKSVVAISTENAALRNNNNDLTNADTNDGGDKVPCRRNREDDVSSSS